jgi:hypothetical protein
MRRAGVLVFEKLKIKKKGFRCYYLIDKKEYSFFTSFSDLKPILDERQKYLVSANVGLSYLLDLAIISLPKKVVIKPIKLKEEALNFWKRTYEKLVIERIYAEKLKTSSSDAKWFNKSNIKISPTKPDSNHNTLLAISGGKESLAVLKMFENKKMAKKITLFFLQYPDRNWYHGKKVYEKLKKKYEAIKIRTEISNLSKLVELYDYKSKNYPTFVIGHLIFNALLYGDRFKYLIINNEYSSNFGNALYQGRKVNHQYDKTISFAKEVNQYINKYINKNFIYFSPFFGFYEYKIAEIFFSNPKYFDIWTSCNNSNSKFNFCARCPKCAFTYVISLPFTTKKFLKKYFRKDLLQDLKLYKPLIDFHSPKPLECVGEKKEVWFALYQIYKQKKDKDSPVMLYFLKNIFPRIKSKIKLIEKDLKKEHTNFIYFPTEFKFLFNKL